MFAKTTEMELQNNCEPTHYFLILKLKVVDEFPREK